MALGHCMLIGQTSSGKTSLAVEFANQLANQGMPVVVLDPFLDRRWSAHYQTTDAQEFLSKLKTEFLCCACFVDEALLTLERKAEFNWLAGASRHRGHVVHFLGQRYAQLSPGIRDNCARLALFNCSVDYAKDAAREFNDPALLTAHDLPLGHYYYKERHKPLQQGKLGWAD